MNKVKIQELLEQWTELNNTGERIAKEKIGKNSPGQRIKRTTGAPVVFDFKTHKTQQTIQNLLCQELPQFADLIRSTPEIMDGYPWIRSDFVELYFSHYRVVVEKLKRLTG
jgi:hypothetical protein